MTSGEGTASVAKEEAEAPGREEGSYRRRAESVQPSARSTLGRWREGAGREQGEEEREVTAVAGSRRTVPLLKEGGAQPQEDKL